MPLLIRLRLIDAVLVLAGAVVSLPYWPPQFRELWRGETVSIGPRFGNRNARISPLPPTPIDMVVGFADGADRGGAAGVIGSLAMRVVEPDHVDTGHQEPFQHGRIVGCGAECCENLGTTGHGSESVVKTQPGKRL